MYLRQCTVIVKYEYFMEISLVFHQIHGTEILRMNRYFELANGKRSWGDFLKSPTYMQVCMRRRVNYWKIWFSTFFNMDKILHPHLPHQTVIYHFSAIFKMWLYTLSIVFYWLQWHWIFFKGKFFSYFFQASQCIKLGFISS